MQTAKNAAATMKATAANIGASAVSGLDKTKAVVEEKSKKITASDPEEKKALEKQKEEKIREAEANKQAAMAYNAATRDQTTGTHESTAKESTGPRSTLPTSALPGYGTGEPAGGHADRGKVDSDPISHATGTERPAAGHDPHVGGETGASTGINGA